MSSEILLAIALICSDRDANWFKVENQKACVAKIMKCLNGSTATPKILECIK